MADDYKADEEAKPKAKTIDGEEASKICRAALDRYARFLEREQENIDNAYDDLAFCWDDQQWPQAIVKERECEDRPVLTVNRLPQFVHQVTGDMRQMKPAIKAVAVDSAGDKDTAETIGGMIRYIENRSDATSVYTTAADSQVSAGIGAWRVIKEYAAESTFNQELRIVGVDDAISIAWDPDAILPTREDAQWCILPVDMSREKFEELYPDAPLEEFDVLTQTSTSHGSAQGWYDKDFIRVAEYWVKKPIKRTLALFQDGSIVDLTNKPEAEQMEAARGAIRVEDRDGFKVCRYLITAAHVLEGPIDWPGMYIPVVPVIGEEIRIGRKVVRRGLIRTAKDPQRMFNYFCSAQAEVTALQPKAPFMVTEVNVEKYLPEWSTANTKALPFLLYTPDSKNGGQMPSRVAPPVSSQGISEGIALAAENMKAVIGIYDASLGQRSNETSGKAIIARQREGDTGTFVYIDNWSRAIRHTGKILIDMIPHVYDTERMIRIMGEDGKIDLKWINRAVGIREVDPMTGEWVTTEQIENDLTVGAYDVVLETGPSYTTKREEAKEGMVEFLRSAPDMGPVIMDLVAKAQDWPLADQIAERLEAVAPAPIQKLLANQKKEQGDEVPPPEPPSPADQMTMENAKLELEGKALANEKTKLEIEAMAQGGGADPTQTIKVQAEMQKAQAAQAKAEIEIRSMEAKLMHEQRMAELEYEIKQTELANKRAGIVQGLESHAVSMTQHAVGMNQGAEKHAATIEKMKAPPENRPSA